jgi:aminobenzoyl-glutamate utilization protein B
MTRTALFFGFLLLVILTADQMTAAQASTSAPQGADNQHSANLDADKTAAFQWIDSNSEMTNKLAEEIWRNPELSFREFKTSRALMQYLDNNGFSIQKNIAGIPTAFVASFGNGKPVVAFWTEEDALGGMSQKIGTAREALIPGGPGHACGHNVIGPSTVASAVAVAKFLQRSGMPGTIRVYGTPAEEAGGGKQYMLEAGAFKDVDVLLGWHPSINTRTEFEYTKTMVEMHVHFKGVASHASVAPDRGRNALHAVELLDVGMNYLREQLPEDVRVSYVISNGGGEPNVIPAEAESWYVIRANKHDEVAALVDRFSEVARGAAMMTGTQVEVRIDNDAPEVLPNKTLAEVLERNLLEVGVPEFSEEEKAFDRRLLATPKGEPRPVSPGVLPLPATPNQEAYSTDLGSVSWSIPTERLAVSPSPYVVTPHTWQDTVNSGSNALKAMPIAAKALAGAAIDCIKDPGLVANAHKELLHTTQGHTYILLTPSDRKPPAYSENSSPTH